MYAFELRIRKSILTDAKKIMPQNKHIAGHRPLKGWWNEYTKEAIKERKKLQKPEVLEEMDGYWNSWGKGTIGVYVEGIPKEKGKS